MYTRREIVAQKRDDQLERMLLPDAPPRKRQTRRISPERQPCIMVQQPITELCAEPAAAAISTPGTPRSAKRRPEEPVEAGVSTSGTPLPAERRPEEPVDAGVSTSGTPLPAERRPEEPVDAGVSTSGTPLPAERRPEEPVEAGVSTSGTPLPAERRPAEPVEAGVSTSGTPLPAECPPAELAESEVWISWEPDFVECRPAELAEAEHWTSWEPGFVDIGAEVDIFASPSPSSVVPSAINVIDKDLNLMVKDWERLTDMCNSDDDDDLSIENDVNLNIYNVACSLPTVHERNAANEPACNIDLTQFQAEVLQREDSANDRALREIVPDDCYTFNWSKDRNIFLGQRETFTEPSGPTFDITDQTQPIDIFDKMFDIDFIDRLCTETNLNAEQKIALLREQNKLSPHSRFHRWSPTNRDEMVSFLAIHILQGLYPLPEEASYFIYNGYGTMPYFAKIMPYNRFLLLKTFLHFVDNQTQQDTTRLYKIRPVIDYFNAKFSSLYMPSQEIAIDESLLKWHGRLSFSQKIASKAAKVGVKTYELCESSSGYLWKFFVYAGKDKSTETIDRTDKRNAQPDEQTGDRPVADDVIDRLDDDDRIERPDNNGMNIAATDRITADDSSDRPTSATAKIVYDLIEPLLHRGHTLIMDNFYNSPLLLRSLKKQKTDCYGTLRLNREFVPESVKVLTKTELRHGEVVATYCSDLSVLVWRDANIVSMISTYHNLQIGTQDKHNRVTYKPSIVLDYNKSMGGVDRKDQFLSAHPMERQRNRVWYKKLFRRLYNDALFNCFVIFSSFHQNISHRKFRTVLAESLLKRHRKIDLTTEPRRLNTRSKTTGQVMSKLQRNVRHKTQARETVEHNHFPVRTGSKNTCCWMCPKKTRTIWKCEECDVNLCIDRCFKVYHKV